MSSALLHTQPSTLTLALPLPVPSVPAAWEFLTWFVPSTVFSAGSGRRRRRGESAAPGRRSDTAYLLFYRRAADNQVLRQPLKSPRSIQSYLRQQMLADPAEHWCALQLTQFRARRDGRPLAGGFTASTGRHILGVVLDLDGARVAAGYLHLLHHDLYALMAILDERMSALGVDCYRLVRSGPNGLHLYIPLIRPGLAGDQTKALQKGRR